MVVVEGVVVGFIVWGVRVFRLGRVARWLGDVGFVVGCGRKWVSGVFLVSRIED